MRLTPIVDRLKEVGFPHVQGALEFAALKNAPGRGTRLYVLPEGEDAAPNRMTGIHRQQIQGAFMVVLVMEAAARREDGVSELLDEETKRIIPALAGWCHPDAAEACDYVRGRLLSVDGSILSWGLTFSTSWFFRKA